MLRDDARQLCVVVSDRMKTLEKMLLLRHEDSQEAVGLELRLE